MSVAEKVDQYNYLDKIDSMTAYEALQIAGDIMDAMRNHDLANKFDIGEIIQRPRKWGEFWIPALNHELWENDETDETLARTEWSWYCREHFAETMPLSVLEHICANVSCEPQWFGGGAEREFPRAE